jgi:hypothetical protein
VDVANLDQTVARAEQYRIAQAGGDLFLSASWGSCVFLCARRDLPMIDWEVYSAMRAFEIG